MIDEKKKELTLRWKGPYTIKSGELFDVEKPGLYLFTVKVKDFYSLHYIGMSTCLSSRIVRHLRSYISGEYYLYNANKLRENKKLGKPEYYLRDYYQDFFYELEKYQRTAREFLDCIHFFLCPFEKENIVDESTGATYFELAESIILNHIFSEEHEKDFPIIDNSKRISHKIYGCGLSIINKFPPDIFVAGLDYPIPR